jgi:hypothetical protein
MWHFFYSKHLRTGIQRRQGLVDPGARGGEQGVEATSLLEEHVLEQGFTLHPHGGPQGKEDGVLIAHGSWNSGYCLMIQDGHLVYDYNYYTHHHILRSTRQLPRGQANVSLRFIKDDDGTGGTVQMHIENEPAGEMYLAETFEYFVAFQGLDVGADRLSPVRLDGHDVFEFEGEFDRISLTLLDGADSRTHEPFD